ncbi:C6 transcription factor 2 [Lasiodiplodia theobromae]|uniref:Zn(2)-C6 fungal-type domain-containing protein n=1 Tax=Lasiodiplodia theobromae TaxID=45133 RepID=A0A5N5CYX9_9PEZI|nr:C6 transcription factor 2 [Lasiodiplodia theobromae]KAB2570589.1 hypothetical protein DBV05_g10734 [Lasiodiplodia theobromae]KAF4545510.1 C6 transcription factor 2 [Lasiodiplodia theobromae]
MASSSSSSSSSSRSDNTSLTWPNTGGHHLPSSPSPDRPPSTILRAACNDCHQAKVKCIFEAQSSACVRCRKRGRDCTRSVSKPLGRARKKPKRAMSMSCTPQNNNDDDIGVLMSPGAGERDCSYCPYADPGADCCLHTNSNNRGEDLDPLFVPPVIDASMDLWFDDSAGLASTPLLPKDITDNKASSTDPQGEGEAHPPVSEISACSCSAALAAMMHAFVPGSSRNNSMARPPDTLLRLNVTALEVARGHLECPRRHGGVSVRMLVLHLVQAALANCREVASAFQGHHVADECVQVRLGSYAVDNDDCGESARLLAHRIIALQVQKKILPLVDALLTFQRRHGGSDDSGGWGPAEEEDDDEWACRLMAGLLRAEADGMIAVLSS